MSTKKKKYTYPKPSPEVIRDRYVRSLSKHVAVDGIKTCAKCKSGLSVDLFDRNRSSPDGRSMTCKSCRRKQEQKPEIAERANAYRRNYSKVKPLVAFKRHLKYSYKITIETYEKILSSQNNACAICRAPHADKLRRRLMVDHCHKTGAIRGLLCGRCNFALGLLRDDVQLILKATSYLMRSRLTPSERADVEAYIAGTRKPHQPRLPL